MGKLTLNWAKLKPEVKQVWQLSLPAILTQITTIAMQYIDSAMVGALGAAASAAIGLVVAMTWLYNGVLSAVSAGFSVQVAHRIGAGDFVEAKKILRQAVTATLVFSSLLAVAVFVSAVCFLSGWVETRRYGTIRPSTSEYSHYSCLPCS